MSGKKDSQTQQSSSSKRFGEIAVERKLISSKQLEDALSAQKELKKLDLPERLGNILKKRNLISDDAIEDVLNEQQRQQRRLGNFEIYEKIGQGAMGVVFRARQLSLDRIVALKILAPKYANDPEFTKRFVREARAAGQFSHENIVTALDVGQSGTYHYFAMEYVEGVSLRSILKEKDHLPEKDALDYTRQVARGLEHALKKNIIHRDVKPDNVMVTKQRNVAKLLDMGLACAVAAKEKEGEGETSPREKGTKITKIGRAVGTPHYMSPEAARGEQDLDTRADIYSLGCMCYHLLTGSPPYDQGQGREIMVRHLTDPVPDVREKKPEISDGTACVVARMTAKDRESRYATPTELVEDLSALLADRKPAHAYKAAGRGSGRLRSKVSGKRAAAARSPKTTGPRRPIEPRGTTGPRKPIEPRGTTGPRLAIKPRTTTGPASPIIGDRTGPHTGVRGGTSEVRDRKKSPLVPWAIMTAGIFVVGVFAMSMMGDSSRNRTGVRKKSTANNTSAPDRSAPVEELKTAHKRPVVPRGPSPQEVAQAALDAALALQKERPQDFAALLVAFEKASTAARETSLASKVEERVGPLHADWRKAYAAVLTAAGEKAREAIDKKDFVSAMGAYAEEQVPHALRVLDWQKQLAGPRENVRKKAEEHVAGLLREARAKAQTGGIAGLEAGIAAARLAEVIPAAIAPSSAEASKERKRWEGELVKARAAEARERAEREQKARAALTEVRKQVTSLLVKGRLKDALQLLDEKILDRSLAVAREELKREKQDLLAVQALREKAVLAIRGKAGETIELIAGKAKFKGKVLKGDDTIRVTLKTSHGAVISISAFQLAAKDVDAAVPVANGKDRARDLLTRGLLYFSAGEWAKAKDYFLQASKAGLGEAAKPYLERIEVIELGAAEVLARKDWEKAETLFEGEKWKAAQAAYQAFAEAHAGTKFFAKQDKVLKERLAKIHSILNPHRPGLLASIYRGREFNPKELLLQRIDKNVNFEWGGGSPDAKVPSNGFCMHWDGMIKIDKPGRYTFATVADDGTRVFLNGKLVFEDWSIHPPKRNSGEIDLKAGTHAFRLEYFEGGGGANCRLYWMLKDGFGEEIIPEKVLFHKPPLPDSKK